MRIAELLVDGFDRVRQVTLSAVDGLSVDELGRCPEPGINSIAWLVWHLARVQDDHVADAAGLAQVWTSKGWVERFGLPFEAAATGYGHTPVEVAQVVADAELLGGYLEDVHAQTVRFVAALGEADLDRTVDESWDPPVTLGVRLVSVLSDDLQHAGQAAYVRGLLGRDAERLTDAVRRHENAGRRLCRHQVAGLANRSPRAVPTVRRRDGGEDRAAPPPTARRATRLPSRPRPRRRWCRRPG